MAHRSAALRIFRKVVLTLGTLLAVAFLAAFIPKLILGPGGSSPEPSAGREWGGRVIAAMFVTYMVGYAVGWWRGLWGGLLIIGAGVLVSVPFLAGGNFGGLIFGIPQFVIGMLYVLLHWTEKRRSTQGD